MRGEQSKQQGGAWTHIHTPCYSQLTTRVIRACSGATMAKYTNRQTAGAVQVGVSPRGGAPPRANGTALTDNERDCLVDENAISEV